LDAMTDMELKILIVDDSEESREGIRSLLLDDMLGSCEIYCADSVLSAKEQLAICQFDILIIDMALPTRLGELPNIDAGRRLLEEVSRKTRYHSPKYVVGVTAQERTSEELEDFFKDNLWYLLKTASIEGGWQSKLLRFVSYVNEALLTSAAESYELDVFVMAAKRGVELEALRDLPLAWSEDEPLDDISYYQRATFGERSRSIAIGSPPRIGLVAATVYAQKVINKLKPKLIVMTGMCAGIHGEAKIGDIIFASQSWEWQSGKYGAESGNFHNEPYQLNVDDSLQAQFTSFYENWNGLDAFWRKYSGIKPSAPPDILTAPVASGSAVVMSDSIVDAVKVQHRKVAGLEMEIFGLYSAAKFSSRPRPLFFAIKGVSDMADSQKADDYQPFCSLASAYTLLSFLEKCGDELLR